MKANIIIILFVLNAATAWGLNSPEGLKLGDWSSSAYFVWPIERAVSKENHILSPDGKWRGIIKDNNLTLETKKNNVKNKSIRNIYLDGLAEIGWASDSSGFFLTRSDGGWVGSWYASVILMKDPKQKEINISQRVARDFHKNISQCPEEEPNIVALAWIEGSRKLLLVAESPNHSSCPDMGNIAGYQISVPSGKILKRYNKTELKNQFEQYFGERLKSKYNSN